jgi:hypothetical protein
MSEDRIGMPHWLQALLFPDFVRDLEEAADRHPGMWVTRSRTYRLLGGEFTVGAACMAEPDEDQQVCDGGAL